METYASDYGSAGGLSQLHNDEVPHPVADYSKQHSPAESNYAANDKEIMAVIKAHEEWSPECEGAAYPLQLITDHKNLEYFMTKKLLKERQAQWSKFLTQFDYQIVYQAG